MKLAAVKLAQQQTGQTLQATALVHEAYLPLVRNNPLSPDVHRNSRGHFFGAAAEATVYRQFRPSRRSGFEVPSELQQIELLAKMVTIDPQVLKPQNSR